MAFDYFLCKCLLPDTLHYSENNRGVTIERRAGETILFFSPDDKNIREETRRYFNTNKFFDVVVYYKKQEDCSNVFFVELKGKDVAHAIKQLDSAIKSFFQKAPIWKANSTVKALILSTGSSPAGIAVDIKRFLKEYNVVLKQKTIQRGREDLRNYI